MRLYVYFSTPPDLDVYYIVGSYYDLLRVVQTACSYSRVTSSALISNISVWVIWVSSSSWLFQTGRFDPHACLGRHRGFSGFLSVQEDIFCPYCLSFSHGFTDVYHQLWKIQYRNKWYQKCSCLYFNVGFKINIYPCCSWSSPAISLLPVFSGSSIRLCRRKRFPLYGKGAWELIAHGLLLPGLRKDGTGNWRLLNRGDEITFVDFRGTNIPRLLKIFFFMPSGPAEVIKCCESRHELFHLPRKTEFTRKRSLALSSRNIRLKQDPKPVYKEWSKMIKQFEINRDTHVSSAIFKHLFGACRFERSGQIDSGTAKRFPG